MAVSLHQPKWLHPFIHPDTTFPPPFFLSFFFFCLSLLFLLKLIASVSCLMLPALTHNTRRQTRAWPRRRHKPFQTLQLHARLSPASSRMVNTATRQGRSRAVYTTIYRVIWDFFLTWLNRWSIDLVLMETTHQSLRNSGMKASNSGTKADNIQGGSGWRIRLPVARADCFSGLTFRTKTYIVECITCCSSGNVLYRYSMYVCCSKQRTNVHFIQTGERKKEEAKTTYGDFWNRRMDMCMSERIGKHWEIEIGRPVIQSICRSTERPTNRLTNGASFSLALFLLL